MCVTETEHDPQKGISSDKTGFSPVFLIMPHYGISGKYPTYLKDTCLLSDLPVYLKDCKFNLTE